MGLKDECEELQKHNQQLTGLLKSLLSGDIDDSPMKQCITGQAIGDCVCEMHKLVKGE